MLGALLATAVVLSSVGEPTLRLVWSDTEAVLPWDSSAIAREIHPLFEEMGVRFLWEDDVDAEPPRSAVSILIVARPADSSRLGLPENTMGVVLGNEPHDAVFVFFRNVVETLGHDPDGTNRSTRERDEINRALARVVAHEVVHAVLADARHDRRGLLRERLDRKHLLMPRLRLSRRAARAFVTRLASAAREAN